MLKHLPDAPLDIVGDVHGEHAALVQLLDQLGYDAHGRHPRGRRLVFVGDLVDRGPGSPQVVERVRRIVEGGHGQAVLGNHELNLLRQQRKDGNDWFWNEGQERDRKYAPWQTAAAHAREDMLAFFAALPLALERDDLRIVHACWHEASLARLRAEAGSGESLMDLFRRWDAEAQAHIAEAGLRERSQQQREQWRHALHDATQCVPMLDAVGASEEIKQMRNPVRVLTSGIERMADAPFFASGQWRFVQRVKWWADYAQDTPVVVGHYWRRYVPMDRARLDKYDPDPFEDIAPTHWHGARGNVFCVDFSVGGRFHERRAGLATGSTTKLAALRWPERTLVLDTGEEVVTEGYGRATT